MLEFVKGSPLAEGKTKVVNSVDGQPNLVILSSKNAVTANDNPALTREIATKGVCSTTTTTHMFQWLKDSGIPVAYRGEYSETEFLAEYCQMIPLEVVARRYLTGSYCKRHPGTGGDPPKMVDPLVVEFFLKTTRGKVPTLTGEMYDTGLQADKGEEDPLIESVESTTWWLLHPKKPLAESGSELGSIEASLVVVRDHRLTDMREIVKRVFLSLEDFWWRRCGYRLIDLKIEFGITNDGRLVVADVIDNDSWRLRTGDWEELSKQVFRDGGELSAVEQKYLHVAQLSAWQGYIIPESA